MRSNNQARGALLQIQEVSPSANRAITASVIAASGMLLQSTSTPRRRVFKSRVTVMALSSHSTCKSNIITTCVVQWFNIGRGVELTILRETTPTLAPIFSRIVANCTSPCMLCNPQPCTLTLPPVIAAPPKKYEAEDASPSTFIWPGLEYLCPPCIVNLILIYQIKKNGSKMRQMQLQATSGLMSQPPIEVFICIHLHSKFLHEFYLRSWDDESIAVHYSPHETLG